MKHKQRMGDLELLSEAKDLDYSAEGYQGLKDYEVAYLEYRKSRIKHNSDELLLTPDLGDEFS
ncbi:hypothetical protein COV13_03935 [Candidatus Woesearchaeota archaeon CG10_big_fil_rev_8_21_14_0_10_32_9]|nr:MAG: hypothetical protein COV13_03935 [Candidatus Woesearchaeota archaeon CG10_big_fil_rev_8_21_14_0_10_32_9]